MLKDGTAKRTQRQLLVDALMSFQSPEECEHFMSGLLSPREFDVMAQRFNVALNLACGKSYNEIANHIHVSSATVGKVKRALYYSKDSKYFEKCVLRFLKNRRFCGTPPE